MTYIEEVMQVHCAVGRHIQLAMIGAILKDAMPGIVGFMVHEDACVCPR